MSERSNVDQLTVISLAGIVLAVKLRSLELLLEHLGAHNLILAGIAGNNCVLFTANDAYMRDFKLFVPADCSVSIEPEGNDYAFQQMQKVLKADIRASTELDLADLNSAPPREKAESAQI